MSRSPVHRFLLLVTASILIVACGTASSRGAASDAPAGGVVGDASRGQQLFLGRGCIACHAVQGLQGVPSSVGAGGLGPELTNIAQVAEQRKPGTSAEEYLRESIVQPDAFVPPGYRRGLMPRLPLTPQQVADLVAFMLALQ